MNECTLYPWGRKAWLTRLEETENKRFLNKVNIKIDLNRTVDHMRLYEV